MVRTIHSNSFSRTEPEHAYSIPLPFYIHGTGINVTQNRQFIKRLGIINQFVEIIWGISGIGEVSLYDRKFQVNPNDIFYYLPGEDHMLRTLSDRWERRWLCLSGPLAETIVQSYQYPRLQAASIEYPEHLFKEIENSFLDSSPGKLRHACAITLDIWGLAGSNRDLHSGLIAKRCVSIIGEKLHDPALNIDMLCDELHVSQPTLTRLFREETGVTPGRYVLNLRYNQATELLRGTNLSVSEVADKCGFAELRSFCRFIKRSTGKSPLQFRKDAQKQVQR